MEYVRAQTQPRDGKVLAIGHSMGGILLYSMLSRYSKKRPNVSISICKSLCILSPNSLLSPIECSGSDGKESGLAAVVTLASSLDYSNSLSTLKLLLPFVS